MYHILLSANFTKNWNNTWLQECSSNIFFNFVILCNFSRFTLFYSSYFYNSLPDFVWWWKHPGNVWMCPIEVLCAGNEGSQLLLYHSLWTTKSSTYLFISLCNVYYPFIWYMYTFLCLKVFNLSTGEFIDTKSLACYM